MQALDQMISSSGMDMSSLAARFGLNPDQAQSALGSLMPAVLGGFLVTIAALIVALLILTTQRHEEELADKRARLTLQIAVLSEKKSSSAATNVTKS